MITRKWRHGKFLYASAALAILTPWAGAVLASPANSIEQERHERREFFWSFGDCLGFNFPYFRPGFYCPKSDVKSLCLYDGPEAQEAEKRGRDVAGIRAYVIRKW